jgi:hypothetical protein
MFSVCLFRLPSYRFRLPLQMTLLPFPSASSDDPLTFSVCLFTLSSYLFRLPLQSTLLSFSCAFQITLLSLPSAFPITPISFSSAFQITLLSFSSASSDHPLIVFVCFSDYLLRLPLQITILSSPSASADYHLIFLVCFLLMAVTFCRSQDDARGSKHQGSQRAAL